MLHRSGSGLLQQALPAFAEGRLLLGRKHSLHGPPLKPLAFAFVLENLRKDLRRMDVLPRLSNGLYTYDAAIGTIHLECSLGEANPTSRDVLSGLDKLFDALLLHVPLKLAAGYMFLGAIAFRRLGGHARLL